MARPRKGEKDQRTERINARFTVAQRMAIEANAAFLGLSPTAFVALKATGDTPRAGTADRQATAELSAALVRIGNNLNQAVRHMNAGKGLLEGELRFTLTRINELLDQLYDPPAGGRRHVVQGGRALLPARQTGGGRDGANDHGPRGVDLHPQPPD